MVSDESPTESAGGPFAAFRYLNYRLFWIGNAFSNIGIWALIAGRLWLMHQLTDSPLMLGLVTFSGLGRSFSCRCGEVSSPTVSTACAWL